MAKTIIGITGTNASGKGTVASYLMKHHGYKHYSAGGLLTEMLEKMGEGVDREKMKDLANKQRQEHGADYLASELYKKAAESDADAVIEALRTVGEVKRLQENSDFTLLAVDAEIETRYKRAQGRASSKDNVTFDEFVKSEKEEMESDDPNRQNLSECIKLADFVIENNGSVEELKHKVDIILAKITSPSTTT